MNNLWFSTPDAPSLCRGGGNGENHPSQLYALKKYWDPARESILDYGSGSGTTYEAIKKQWSDVDINYLGLDIIPKFTQYCKERFPEGNFEVNKELHKICQPDKSWDVVYSRHVVDHMKSFEEAMDEHCRVSKRLVIVVLWVGFSTSDQHVIKNIVDQGVVYKDEYTNSYSEDLVMKYLQNKKGWNLLEVTKGVGAEVRGHDIVIVMERNK